MASRYLLGFDVGSSSVKASLTDVDNGENRSFCILSGLLSTHYGCKDRLGRAGSSDVVG